MIPLGFLSIGHTGVVKDIIGGKNVRQRLTGMGLVRGAIIRMIQNDNCGPLIVALNEGRVVIGQGVAHKVMVEEVG